MRLRTRFPLILASMSALLGPPAFAQYVGPSTAPAYRSVADVLKDPVDDASVVLDGLIIKLVGKKKYISPDGTAEIRVEIDPKYFPATPVNEKMKVQIRGEIEKDFLQSPEIDVEYLAIVK